jgi:histidine ammonia-lyase
VNILYIEKKNSHYFFLLNKSDLHASRPHIGQNLVAQRLRALLASPLYPSEISQSHVNCGKVQDAYSIRCIPQVSNLF